MRYTLEPMQVVGFTTVRTSQHDLAVLDGKLVIPRDCSIFLPLGLPHMSSTIFPNPDQFLPERWLGTEADYMPMVGECADNSTLLQCVSVCVCLCLCLCLSVSLCLCLRMSLSVCVSICVCGFLSVCLSVCLFLSVCVCLAPICFGVSLCIGVYVCLCLYAPEDVFACVHRT